MPILTLPASFSTAGNDASSSAPSTSPHAVLATLQDELRALLHPARAAPTAAVAGQASPAVAEPAPAEQMTAVELDRAAERAVKEHFALLHAYNEVRDAVENMIDKYGAMTGKTSAELKEDLGLAAGD